MGNFNTSDTNFPDLNGSMNATGNNINTYHSKNLGDATNVNNRQAPPPVSCVLTFSNGQQYTICGRPSGTGFVGQAKSGNIACPNRPPRDDDWTATAVNLNPKPKPKLKPAKKLTVKAKAVKKSASKAMPAKKPASKKKQS